MPPVRTSWRLQCVAAGTTMYVPHPGDRIMRRRRGGVISDRLMGSTDGVDEEVTPGPFWAFSAGLRGKTSFRPRHDPPSAAFCACLKRQPAGGGSSGDEGRAFRLVTIPYCQLLVEPALLVHPVMAVIIFPEKTGACPPCTNNTAMWQQQRNVAVSGHCKTIGDGRPDYCTATVPSSCMSTILSLQSQALSVAASVDSLGYLDPIRLVGCQPSAYLGCPKSPATGPGSSALPLSRQPACSDQRRGTSDSPHVLYISTITRWLGRGSVGMVPRLLHPM